MADGGTVLEERAPSPRPPEPAGGREFGGDGGTTTGWVVKIVLLGLADAVAVAGLIIAVDQQAWGYAAVLAVVLAALNVVYLPRRFVPMKYLLPGLCFLAVFGLYPVLYTIYASTTNYGTGFVLSKSQAIERILANSVGRAEGSTSYEVTALAGPDGRFAGYGLYDPETGAILLGTADSIEPIDDPTPGVRVLASTGRTFIDAAGDYTGVLPGGLDELPGYPADPGSYVMRDDDGAEVRIQGTQAYAAGPTLAYDEGSDTITDITSGVEYRPVEGRFVDADGNGLTPGYTVRVGFDNYSEVLTTDTFRGHFLRVLLWNVAFAVLSVLVTFAVGLGLAMVFDETRMRGRKIYRSLVIIPYALPAFMTALVWRGLLNRTFGVNRWLGLDIGWLESTGLAMTSLILVNLWLGYPYMFLVCTGALQSIPKDLKEAAFVDGATGLRAFRQVTFPLLLTAVSPLLVASFAFNFNNFTIVYLVTGGGPRPAGETAGSTDILLSWIYRISFDADPKQQALGASLSVFVFLIVGALSALGFKYTKTFEEAR